MYSSNPFPQLPYSTNGFSPPNSFFHHENDDIHYNSSGEFHFYVYKGSATPPVLENATRIDQDFVCEHQFSEDHSELLDSVISGYKKTTETSKKDGHSKIYTARGPRDRRVRLSIDIARKFFCLQELLGFDKASETLDWLFSKSLAAIKELVEEKSCSSSTGITDESKLTFLETINAGSEKKAVPNSKKKKTTRRSKYGFHEDFARDQSRTEARARARERTREKLRAKKLDDDDDDDTFVRDCCESGNIWAPTEPKIDYKDITWECIMDQETSKQSNDSRFQINMIS